jgi:predicted N-acetyltransferase YhbS
VSCDSDDVSASIDKAAANGSPDHLRLGLPEFHERLGFFDRKEDAGSDAADLQCKQWMVERK